jgi:hypothetical protein
MRYMSKAWVAEMVRVTIEDERAAAAPTCRDLWWDDASYIAYQCDPGESFDRDDRTDAERERDARLDALPPLVMHGPDEDIPF